MSLRDHLRRFIARREARRNEARAALAEHAGPDADGGALCPACAAPSRFRAAEHRDSLPLTVYGCPVCGLIWSRETPEPIA